LGKKFRKPQGGIFFDSHCNIAFVYLRTAFTTNLLQICYKLLKNMDPLDRRGPNIGGPDPLKWPQPPVDAPMPG